MTDPPGSSARSPDPFTAVDWGGALLAGAAMAGLMTLRFTGFGAMFRDLGSLNDLPLLTRFALSPWFAPVVALPAAAFLGLGVRARHRASERRKWIAAAFIVAGLGYALFTVAMYLPIFSIAGRIKAD